MGHRGHHSWATGPDHEKHPWQQHGGSRRGSGWGGPGWVDGPFEGRGRGGRGGPMGGPPPWVAGLFGLGQPDRGRGPRVRRGDVRVAILDVLATAARAEEPINGYQVIQQIAERSEGGWRPSPGSVYPTIQQLQDEGLVETDDERGRRSLRLTEAGHAYVAEHPDELAAVWAPFERSTREGATQDGEHVDLKSELGQVMPAVWQIVTQGSEAQRRAAVEILADTRRRLYGVLADGPGGDDPEPEA
ncbi:PadR family transcriptional regulator [Nocardioides rubriscoriae]|uniref:PadR family transcriptional regulator n=1 Tax=Nocardioides rubriscoriae TaxID=642762 RepID=UPI0011DF0FC4|nr:PadR family transcriptional regulator [Nocardioides rubriscoriae]